MTEVILHPDDDPAKLPTREFYFGGDKAIMKQSYAYVDGEYKYRVTVMADRPDMTKVSAYITHSDAPMTTREVKDAMIKDRFNFIGGRDEE